MPDLHYKQEEATKALGQGGHGAGVQCCKDPGRTAMEGGEWRQEAVRSACAGPGGSGRLFPGLQGQRKFSEGGSEADPAARAAVLS